MRSTLSTLQEGHANLQDKYDAFSHTTSQKLAIQAAELTAPEVKSSPSPPRRTRRTKQLRLSAPKLSLCNLHSVLPPSRRATSRDTNPKRQAASMLRAELTRQAEHTRHLEAACARDGRAERLARTSYAHRGASRREQSPRALRGFCGRAARDCRAPRGGGRSCACGVQSIVCLPFLSFSYIWCEPHGCI